MLFFILFLSFCLRVIRKGKIWKSSLIFGGPRVSLCVSGLTADHYFWCSRVFLAVLRVFRGIMGCSRGVPGLFRAVLGVFRGCSGVFRGCSGVFRGVPGLFLVLQTPTHFVSTFNRNLENALLFMYTFSYLVKQVGSIQ